MAMSHQINFNMNFTANTQSVEANLNSLKTSLSSINAMPVTFGKTINQDLVGAAHSAKQLQMHLTNAMNTKTGNIDLSKFQASLTNSNQSLSQLTNNLLNAGNTGKQAFLQLHSALAQAGTTLRTNNSLMGNFLVSIKNVAKWQISSTIFRGITTALSNSISFAKQLNTSLTNIGIVTGRNASSMADFAKYANNAAKELRVTTKAYTDAALIFYQQGLDDKSAKERTNIALKLANVTGESVSEAASNMTAIWNNFADGSQTLEKYADSLTALGAATASSTKEISEGLSKFAAVADTVGLSYDYATSALATVVAETRQSADVVGTAFKTIFARLEGLKLGKTLDDNTSLNQYSSALLSVGVNIKDASGNLKDMDTILNEVGKTWITLEKDQQVALAQSVAGIRQYSQFIALMDNWDKVQKNVEISKDSEGTLERQQAIYAQSWEGAAKNMKASLEGVWMELIPTDAIVEMINGFAKIMDGLSDLLEAFGGLKTILLLITNVVLSKFQLQIGAAIETGITKAIDFTAKVTNLKSVWGTLSSAIASPFQQLISVFKGVSAEQKNVINGARQAADGWSANKTKFGDWMSRQGSKIGQHGSNYKETVGNQVQAKIDRTPDQTMYSQRMASLTEAEARSGNDEGYMQQLAAQKNILNVQNDMYKISSMLTAQQKQQIESQLSYLKTLEEQVGVSREKIELLKEESDLIKTNQQDSYSANLTRQSNKSYVSDAVDIDPKDESHFRDIARNIGNATEATSTINNSEGSFSYNTGAQARETQTVALDVLRETKTMEMEINDILNQQSVTGETKKQQIDDLLAKKQSEGKIDKKTLDTLKNQVNTSKLASKSQKESAESADNIRKAFSRVTTITKQVAKATGVLPKNIAATEKNASDLYKTQKQNVATTKQLREATNGVQSVIQGVKATASGIGVGLVQGMKGAAQLAMGLNMVTSAWEQLNEEGLSFANVSSLLMGASMAIPALLNVIKMLASGFGNVALKIGEANAAKILSNNIDKATIGQQSLQIINQGLLNGLTDAEIEAQLAANLVEQTGISTDAAATAASNLLATAKLGEAGATSVNTGAVFANAAAWYAHPIMWIVAIILAVIAAIVLLATVLINNNNKAVQEAAQKAGEHATAMQEQIDTTQELASELSKLVDEYEKLRKSGGDTTEALNKIKEKMPEVIQSYKDLAKELSGEVKTQLDEAITKLEYLGELGLLTGDLSAFEKQQEVVDQEIAQAEHENAAMGLENYAKSASMKMAEDNSGSSASGGQLVLDVGGARGGLGEEQAARDILLSTVDGAVDSGGWFKEGVKMTVDTTDPQQFIKYYEQLQEARSRMNEEMTAEQRAASDIYREIDEALQAGAEQYEAMIPLANAQAESAATLVESKLRTELKMRAEAVDTMEEYLAYREEYIRIATKEYNLTEAQAEANLKNMVALQGVNAQYELGAALIKMQGGNIKDLNSTDLKKYMEQIEELVSVNDLDESEVQLAVSIAMTSSNIEDFQRQLQHALVDNSQTKLQELKTNLSTALKEGVEEGLSPETISLLQHSEEFENYLKENGNYDITAFKAMSLDEQYSLVQDFYSNISGLMIENNNLQKALYYGDFVAMQENYKTYLNNESDILKAKEHYAGLQTQLSNAKTEAEKKNIEDLINKAKESFESDYGFSIEMDLSSFDDQMKSIEDKILALNDQQIKMAIEWDGIDEIDKSMEDAGKFTKLMREETKKVGNSYQLTAAQAKEWMQVYPDLFEQAQVTTDGIIQLDASQTEFYLDNLEEKRKADIEDMLEDLDREEQMLLVRREAAQADMEIAEANLTGKENLEGASADYLIQTRRNLIQYYMDLGLDEANAQKATLETMGLNQEEYVNLVTAGAEQTTQVSLDGYQQSETGAVGSLTRTWNNFKNFFKSLKNLAGNVLKAIFDSSYSFEDALADTDAFSMGLDTETEIRLNSKYKNDDFADDFTFESLKADDFNITAALEYVNTDQYANLNSELKEIDKALESITNQRIYLNALYNQDLSDYGSTDVDEVTGNDKELEELAKIADRYHEITRAVEEQERVLNNLSKIKSQLYGKNALKALDDEIKATENMIDLLNDQYEAQKLFLTIDRSDITSQINGVQFGENGEILNYSQVVKAITDQYNKAVETYNNSEQNEYDQDALDAAEEHKEDMIELLETYEETLDDFREAEDKLLEYEQKLKEFNYEKITTTLELKIELEDAELTKLEYYLDKIEDDLWQMSDAMALTMDKINPILDKLAAEEQALKDLEEAYKNKEITEADYVEGLKSGEENIYELLTELNELERSLDEFYSNTLSSSLEEISKYTEQFDHFNTLLEHYSNIMELAGQKKNYAAMREVLDGTVTNLDNKLNSAITNFNILNNEAEKWKEQMNNAIEDSEEWEEYKNNYEAALAAAQTAQEEMYATAEEKINALKTLIENNLAEIADKFENMLTKGLGFDSISKYIDLASSHAEEFLTKTNQIYKTESLINKAQQAFDKSNNAYAQNKLQAYIDQVKQLQQQSELSQLELKLQEQQYNLLLAEIALQELQNQKTKMMLTRDAYGNYVYTYVSDEQKVLDAQQKFYDEENKLYNIRLEAANQYMEKQYTLQQEFYNDLIQLNEDYLNGEIETEEEYWEKYNEIRDYYYSKIEDATYLYQVAVSGESRVLEEAWSTDLSKMIASEDELLKNTQNFVTDSAKELKKYREDVAATAKSVGIDLVGEDGNADLVGIKGNIAAVTNASDLLATTLNEKTYPAIESLLDLIGDNTSVWTTFENNLGKIKSAMEKVAEEAGVMWDMINGIYEKPEEDPPEVDPPEELTTEGAHDEQVSIKKDQHQTQGTETTIAQDVTDTGITKEFIVAKDDSGREITLEKTTENGISTYTHNNAKWQPIKKAPVQVDNQYYVEHNGKYYNIAGTDPVTKNNLEEGNLYYDSSKKFGYIKEGTKESDPLQGWTKLSDVKEVYGDNDLYKFNDKYYLFKDIRRSPIDSDYGKPKSNAQEVTPINKAAGKYQFAITTSPWRIISLSPTQYVGLGDYVINEEGEGYCYTDKIKSQTDAPVTKSKFAKGYVVAYDAENAVDGWFQPDYYTSDGEGKMVHHNGSIEKIYGSDKKSEIISLFYHTGDKRFYYQLENGYYVKGTDIKTAFDTGGYTGSWGPEGKAAILHEKELILNKTDTKNILASVSIVRELDTIISQMVGSINSLYSSILNDNINTSNNKLNDIQQQITIHADFPSVQSAQEIEMALTNLTLDASQYIGIQRD